MTRLLLVLIFALPLGAQTLGGYTPARAAAQRSAEQAAIRRPDTARVGVTARALADRPHIAGTAAQADALATAFFVMNEAEIAALCAAHPQIGAALVAPGEELIVHGALREILTR